MTEVDRPGLALLRTLQLADSFFPTGAYAHSLGLEEMVALGWVHSAQGVGEYLAELLANGVLPSDGVALLHAHRRAEADHLQEIIEIDCLLHAMKLPEEMRRASTQSGRRFLDESDALLSLEEVPEVFQEYRKSVISQDAPGNSAVAFAVLAWAAGIEVKLALPAYCHSLVVGLLGAAQRILPLSHTDAQKILRSLHGQIITGHRQIEDMHWRDMTAFNPLADIASMRHERAEVRMFAS